MSREDKRCSEDEGYDSKVTMMMVYGDEDAIKEHKIKKLLIYIYNNVQYTFSDISRLLLS